MNCQRQTQIGEGGPRGCAAATNCSGGVPGCVTLSSAPATDCRSGSMGVGGRVPSGDALDTHTTQTTQLCAGWLGWCGAGCDPRSVWQIGGFPTG